MVPNGSAAADSPSSGPATAQFPRRRSWIGRYSIDLGSTKDATRAEPARASTSRIDPIDTSVGGITPLTPTSVCDSPISYKRSSTSSILTSPQQLDAQASQLILNALDRTSPAQPPSSPAPSIKDLPAPSRTSGSFGKLAFNSMLGGLSALSLTRTSTSDDRERGRPSSKEKEKDKQAEKKQHRSASAASKDTQDDRSQSRARARSQSPFSLRRFRSRDPSPTPQPLPLSSDAERDSVDEQHQLRSIRPRSGTAFEVDDSETETYNTEDEGEESEWSDKEEGFDLVTEQNTERNALIPPDALLLSADPESLLADEAAADPDPLGEGVNVVVPPEPYFPSTLNHTRTGGGSRKGKGSTKRKKSKHHEPLPCVTSRPAFQRDRCTLTVTQGDPEAAAGEGKRRKRTYVVASDLSEESRYAVEWGIGTVLRDGDEMLIVTVVENESKVDPPTPNATDRATKLRSQQERQGLAYILVRQAISLLQRTRLHVVVSCQAWHAKNARHMLLDIVDYNEPTMLIVGSRGLGQLKGILLGSTSHYLIQRCSVPVMVARRRLKRPPRRSAHLAKHRAHVSLAEAGIDRVAARVDQDVAVMRDEIQRDDDRRDGASRSRLGSSGMGGVGEQVEEEGEEEGEEEEGENGEGDEGLGRKVAG